MEMTPEAVRDFLHNELRPRIRVDGGDIVFASLNGDTVAVDARGQCASCPATCDGLVWWMERKLAEKFGHPLKLTMRRKKNYFA